MALSADYLGVPHDLRAKSERPSETLVDTVNQRTDVTVARLLFEEGLGHGKTPMDFVPGGWLKGQKPPLYWQLRIGIRVLRSQRINRDSQMTTNYAPALSKSH